MASVSEACSRMGLGAWRNCTIADASPSGVSMIRAVASAFLAGAWRQAQDVARHHRAIAPVFVAELADEVALLTPHDAKMQKQPARDHQQRQPIDSDREREPDHQRPTADIHRIANPLEYTVGGKHQRRPQWIDIGAARKQRMS